MMRVLLALLLLLPIGLRAEEVVLGLSEDSINITTDFHGSSILIFGAIDREAPKPQDPMQVIITVAGPNQPVTVRRKARQFGIWMNTDYVDVDAAPSFYAIATTAPWDQVITDTEDVRNKISIPRAIRSVGAPMTVQDSQSFSEALIRVRSANGLYSLNEGAVEFTRQTLFRTTVSLPADLTEGDYMVRIFLTRGGQVVADYERQIDVRKVGLERWVFNLSRQQPLIYALLSLALAVLAGWGASEAFRRLRG